MSASTLDSHDPRPAAVSFVTTEHFTLQGARAATIAESTGRATMFLGAVSGGLIALGLLAQASHQQQLDIQGLATSRAQKFLTIAGALAVITSILTGSAAGLLGAVLSDRSSAVAFSTGGVIAGATLTLMMHHVTADMARGLYPEEE